MALQTLFTGILEKVPTLFQRQKMALANSQQLSWKRIELQERVALQTTGSP